jgi:hypothetical protein
LIDVVFNEKNAGICIGVPGSGKVFQSMLVLSLPSKTDSLPTVLSNKQGQG